MDFTKIFRKTLCLALLLSIGQASTAQKITVSPLPQEITWGETKAFDSNVSFKVKGLKTADTDALALLQKKFNLDGKKIKLVIGERGDKAVKKYDALIPQKNTI